MFSQVMTDGYTMLMSPGQGKLLSMAATARLIWLCACVRYWPGRGLVYVCPLLYVCTVFNATESSSIYFLSITVIHDISKQIQQRARFGKIFVRWHLPIAITSTYLGEGCASSNV